MKVFCKRKKLNNEGMALVMVIVVIALVTIFASVLMSMALLNFKMKMTERQAKKTFYSAEEVLDQIHIGLEESVSGAINEAYSKAMQTYKVDEFTERYRVAQFKLDYMLAVKELLFHNRQAEQFDANLLVDMLDMDLQDKHADGKLTICNAINDGSMIALVSTTEGLFIKDLKVEYSEGEYYSCIETDIRIGYPEVELNEATIIPNVLDYSMIAREKLTFMPLDKVEVSGNIYAGGGGVELLANAKKPVIVKDTKYFVNRGELTVNPNTSLELYGDGFWCKGILVDGSGELKLDGDIYVQDDLTLRGGGKAENGNKYGPVVGLEGNYYGYGDGSEVLSGISAGNSAIILNCKNALLDMNGLDTLMLCGNAYVNGRTVTVDNSLYDLNEEVMLGTSVAMKTDQIAFLAPVECLGTIVDEMGETKALVGRNPMSLAEYNLWASTYPQNYASQVGRQYKMLNADIAVSALKEPLSAYGLMSNNRNCFQTIFKTMGSGETICYVYLDFDSAEMADKYYRDYMTACEENMAQYLEKYNNEVRFDGVDTKQLTSGNILTYRISDGYMEPLKETILSSMDSDENKALEQQKKVMVNNYAALCSKLTTNYSALTQLELGQDVYENLIEEAAVEAVSIIGKEYELNGTCALVIDNNDEGSAAPVVLDLNASGAKNYKLVIATGDVIVKSSFSGQIIAGGEIIVNTPAGATIGSDNPAVSKLLQYKPADLGGLTLMEAYFVNGADYVLKGNSINDSAYVNLDSVISYVNWTKK